MLPTRSSSGWRSSRGSPKLSEFPRVPEQLLEAWGCGVNPPTGCSEVTRSLPNGIWGGSTGAELRERKPSGQPGESGLREGKEKARRSPGAMLEELLWVLSSLLPAFLPFQPQHLFVGRDRGKGTALNNAFPRAASPLSHAAVLFQGPSCYLIQMDANLTPSLLPPPLILH